MLCHLRPGGSWVRSHRLRNGASPRLVSRAEPARQTRSPSVPPYLIGFTAHGAMLNFLFCRRVPVAIEPHGPSFNGNKQAGGAAAADIHALGDETLVPRHYRGTSIHPMVAASVEIGVAGGKVWPDWQCPHSAAGRDLGLTGMEQIPPAGGPHSTDYERPSTLLPMKLPKRQAARGHAQYAQKGNTPVKSPGTVMQVALHRIWLDT